jgi:hypothetical protein
MKKNLFALCALFVFIFATTSCDEATSTSEGYFQGLYTVDRNFLRPEMIDTFYKVDNIVEFGLKNGDRAYITLAYEYDNYYGPANTKYYIKSVDKIVPVYGLTALSDIDTSDYSYPIFSLEKIFLNNYMSGAMWLWKNFQNVNIGYYSNGTEGDFKLSPVKLSGDTLCFALNAKIENGEKYKTKFLSFDITSAVNILPAEEAEKLVKLDSIYTQISTLWHDEDNDTVKVMYPFGGKYKNCFKK